MNLDVGYLLSSSVIMKVRHSLIIGCMTALLGVGAFVGAGTSREVRVEKAEAATSNREITLINDTYWWYTNEDAIKVHVWDGGATDSTINMEMVANSARRKWTATVNVSDTSMIEFIRCSEDYTTDWNWSSKTTMSDGDYFTLNNDAPGGYDGASITRSYSNGTYLRGTFQDPEFTDYGQKRMSASDKDGYSVMLKDFTITKATRFKVVYYTDGVMEWGGNISGHLSDDDANYPLYEFSGSDGYLTASGTYDLYVNTTSNDYYVVSPTGRYATKFLEEIVCPGEVYSGGSEKWDLMSGLFTSSLNSGARGKFTSASANMSGTIVEQAVARYDAVVRHYGASTYANYMSRTISPAPSGSIAVGQLSNDMANSGYFAAIASAFVALIAAAGFVIIKKKKSI